MSETTKPFLQDTKLELNSYVGHTFEVRELPSVKTGECGVDNVCHAVHFLVKDDSEESFHQRYVVKGNWEIDSDRKNEADDDSKKAKTLSECEEISKAELLNDNTDTAVTTTTIFGGLIECLQKSVIEGVSKLRRIEVRQSELLTHMGALWANYSCHDDSSSLSITTEQAHTPALRSYTWKRDNQDLTYLNIKVLLDKPNSQIHYIPNFISEEECQAFQDVATPHLSRASVASDDGGSTFTDNFKAKSSYVAVPYANQSHPITLVSHRIFDFTNHITDLNLKHNGQETPMYVQYTGNHTSPDVYQPHKDYVTTPHNHTYKHGTRIATMLMYCSDNTNNENYYTTNFQNVGIQVKPNKYSAIFVSYINPTTHTMDGSSNSNGVAYTLKRSCPLYQGKMDLITQYVRLGVDDESPWSDYDSLGVKRSERDV